MTKYGWALLLISTAVAGGGLYAYWRYEAIYPSTSDAYATAHVVRIEPQIGGRVVRVSVKNHQKVSQGQMLIAIDDRLYRIAVRRAQAELVLAQQQKLAADATVEASNAMITQRQVQLDNARRRYGRDTRMLARQAVSQAQTDSDYDKLRVAEAALKAGQAVYNRALREKDEAGARIGVAEAARDQARLNLSYTTINAPASGVLGKILVRPGDIVQAGQPLFPLVENRTFWVDANYKETDLARIRPGQPVTIKVDMYRGKTFKGVVESVSPASGAAFSLLPPENATGNWVKVTQRFPVRVRVITRDGDPPLRIGASSSVTIDTSGPAEPDNPANGQVQRGE